MKKLLVLLALAFFSCSKEAQTSGKNVVVKEATSMVKAATEKVQAAVNMTGKSVDLEKSMLKWTGYKVGSKHFGNLKLKAANLKREGNKIIGGMIIADMNSMTVEDIGENEGAGKLLGHLKNDDFFGVDKHPVAKLMIRALDANKGSGELTVKGVTQPVDFTYAMNGNQFNGKLSFDRTKFNIKYGSGSFFDNLGDKVINDNVDIDFNIVLK